jgi:broad specificity phosphatase PhoE
MAPRIVLVAHAATTATRRGAFALDEDIERPDLAARPFRAAAWLSGPELRCRRTAGILGWPVKVENGLADLDAGRWAGADLGELMAADPEGVHAWMTDVAARPHDGESLGQLVERVGGWLDMRSWPDGRSVLVTSPLVVRAAIAHLLRAPNSLLFAVDIEPLSAAVLTGYTGRWKLRGLLPWGSWNVQESSPL